jgi:hypothetical protein
VLEVERQDRGPCLLGNGHHDSVDETEIEVGVTTVELDGATERARRREDDGVLACDESLEEQSRATAAHACPQKLVDLDYDGLGDGAVRAPAR